MLEQLTHYTDVLGIVGEVAGVLVAKSDLLQPMLIDTLYTMNAAVIRARANL